MRLAGIITITLILVFVSASPATADSTGRIYGKITTVDGDVFEGLIRWDRNEGTWVDFLNGNKKLSSKHRSSARKYRDRKKKITIFGILLGYRDTDYL